MAHASLRNFVNGKYADPRDGAYSDVVDPSTGEAYAQAPVSSAADVDEALNAAAAAFETWRDATPAERSLAMLRFADAVEQLRFFAGAARMLEGRSAGEYMKDHTSMIRREPIGVCAQVTPWNYPL